MTIPQLMRARLASHRLAGRRFASPTDVVGWLGAVQAQDYDGAVWGVGLRSARATAATIGRLFDEGRILRTHLLRPTWHFVLPEDIRWMLALTGPRVQALNARRYRELELDARLRARCCSIFETVLRDGAALTRRELAAELEAKKINPKGQRMPHILMHAELEGIICSGPRKGKQQTYALLEERVPKKGRTMSEEESIAELARRYFTSHGPATASDFRWWSGLTMLAARVASDSLGSGFKHVEVEGKRYSQRTGRAPSGGRPLVHLLPNYDELTVAYRDREGAYDAGLERRPAAFSSILLGNVITVNGSVVGSWRRERSTSAVSVKPSLLRDLSPAERDALERAIARYARFVGVGETA